MTQSDLNQPGLIKAALRPGGLETQHCFCCPIPKVYSPWRESEREGRVLLIKEKETIPWLRCTLFHSLLVEIKQFLYFYVCFLQPLGLFFLPPPSFGSILSLINPVSSMALINRTLVTSYTWSARCLKLPPMSLLFLSFPLFPSSFSIVFLLSTHPFIHLAFMLVISVFEFDWLKTQFEGL